MLMGLRGAGLFLQWSKGLALVLFLLSSQHSSVAALGLGERLDWLPQAVTALQRVSECPRSF